MKRFEYTTYRYYNQNVFNDLGDEGWELVCKNGDMFIFKRELPSKGWIPTEQVRKMLNEEDEI